LIKDANLEEILAEGILIIISSSTMLAEMHVECAAPILCSLILMIISVSATTMFQP